MFRYSVPFAALAVLMATCGTAVADGGYVIRRIEQTAHSAATADQRAIIVYDQGRETLVLQTGYQGDAQGFAWIIPTPSQALRNDIAEADEKLFDDLYTTTEPRATGWVIDNGMSCYGCSGDDGQTASDEYAGVNVWDRFRVTSYDVAVLSADDSANLETWLSDNGYALPEHGAPIIDYYVTKGWYFVALKIVPTPATSTGGSTGGGTSGRQLRPIRISFATDTPVFPLNISRLSTRREVSVLLYVIAPHVMLPANWRSAFVSATNSSWQAAGGGSFATYYEQELRATLNRISPGGMAVEYARLADQTWVQRVALTLGLDPMRTYYLTRLRSYLTPDEMDTDIQFTAAPTDTYDFRIQLRLGSSYQHAQAYPAQRLCRFGMAGLLLIGAITNAHTARRRRGAWQRALLAVLALVICVL